jgi:hypothetical protein
MRTSECVMVRLDKEVKFLEDLGYEVSEVD